MKLIREKKRWFLILLAFLVACSSGLNLFTDRDEIALGLQLDQEIRKNVKEYPIYTKNPAVVSYIDNNIFKEILRSPEIKKSAVYTYKMEIIDKDSILNAFATPGGYVYIYSGLLKYLDSEAALAGVIAHEIAHIELRHSTQRMTKANLLNIGASLLLGQSPSQVAVLAANLFSGLYLLKNSRKDEDQADDYSFRYLVGSRFYEGSVKFFFEKLKAEGKVSSIKQSGLETFFSTHPDPIERIETTNYRLKALGYEVRDYTTNNSKIFREEYKKNILDRMASR